MITLTEDGYYSTTARGISYIMRIDQFGRFEVSSQRLALVAARMGGTVRFFKNAAEVEKSIKAFKGLSALMELNEDMN